MKTEKKLAVIGVISFIISATVFYIKGKPGSGIFKSVFEIFLGTGLTFVVLAINFFAIVFLVKKIRGFF